MWGEGGLIILSNNPKKCETAIYVSRESYENNFTGNLVQKVLIIACVPSSTIVLCVCLLVIAWGSLINCPSNVIVIVFIHHYMQLLLQRCISSYCTFLSPYAPYDLFLYLVSLFHSEVRSFFTEWFILNWLRGILANTFLFPEIYGGWEVKLINISTKMPY